MFQIETPRSWIPAFAGMTGVGGRSLPPRKRGSDGPKKAIGARRQGAASKTRHSHETRHLRLLPVTSASSPSFPPPSRHSRESGNPSRSTPSGAPRFDVFEVRRTARRPLHDAYMANTSPLRHVSRKRFRRRGSRRGTPRSCGPPPGLPPMRGEECARPCRRRRSGVALEEGERRASGDAGRGDAVRRPSSTGGRTRRGGRPGVPAVRPSRAGVGACGSAMMAKVLPGDRSGAEERFPDAVAPSAPGQSWRRRRPDRAGTVGARTEGGGASGCHRRERG